MNWCLRLLGQRSLAFLLMLSLAALLLAGCAHTVTSSPFDPTQPAPPLWEGRLSVHIASQPVQTFSSSFSLQGSAERGVLTFYTPLGSTAAQLQWAPNLALWQQGREQRQYADLSSLLIDATGADLPIAALFDWLQGQASPVSHWSVDTSMLSNGKLRAQREAANGQPAVDVRVVLDR